MPRPMTRPHLVKLRLTDDEHAAALLAAGGAALGPSLLARALHGPPPVPMTPRAMVAALEAWATALDRRSTSKTAALRCLADLARLVRDA